MAHPIPASQFRLEGGGYFMLVTVDPSAGAGIAAPVGSVAMRSNAGVGELWQKIAAADTGWQALPALNVAQTWSKLQRPEPYALTPGGANVSLPIANGNVFTLELTQATQQLDNPTGTLATGMPFEVIVKQDVTGGRALTFGTQYDWGDEGAPDLSVLTGGQYAVISCLVLASNLIFAIYAGRAG